MPYSDQEMWSSRKDYHCTIDIVAASHTDNDCATDFNQVLTLNESQCQLIIQLAEYHQKQISTQLENLNETWKLLNEYFCNELYQVQQVPLNSVFNVTLMLLLLF
jgi:hypothetical protein